MIISDEVIYFEIKEEVSKIKTKGALKYFMLNANVLNHNSSMAAKKRSVVSQKVNFESYI